jgi:putative acetyltransferase
VPILSADFDHPAVRALLRLHLERAFAVTPVESRHALDMDGLRRPDITAWALWQEEQVQALGALRLLAPGHGEVKSMFTADAARRQGAASTMLGHIIAQARAAGCCLLSLETGATDYFAPARALYRRHGFSECGAYPPYQPDPNSCFMQRAL